MFSRLLRGGKGGRGRGFEGAGIGEEKGTKRM